MLHQLQVKMWAKLCAAHVPTFTPSDVLEIDEMWITWKLWDEETSEEERKKDYMNGIWILGLINRERTKLWIEWIPDRSSDSISNIVDPLLQSWLLRKPRIITDKHAGYNYLSAENTHYVINKAQDGFAVNETTYWGNCVNVNVNLIENTWMNLRKHLKLRNAYANKHLLKWHIAEFVYNWYQLSWYDLIQFP